MKTRICDEWAGGVGWIAAEPEFLERASHALRADGRVWLVDPVAGEGVEERVRALGEPAGVIQLLDRHDRDCAALAERLGVPFHRVPFEGVPRSPFEVIRVRDRRGWREAALWWPEESALVCADALGTARYYRASGERLAVHPLLRLALPRALRDMARGLTPGHVLSGHGAGIHGEEAAPALVEAVATARRRIPSYLIGLTRGRWRP
jgi:hypothetical protein